MIKCIIALTVLAFFSLGRINAQGNDSANPYWVTEANVNKPDVTLVKLYSAEGHLFHEVKIEGKIIDIGKPRHKRMLNQILKKNKHRNVASGKEFKSVSSI